MKGLRHGLRANYITENDVSATILIAFISWG